MKLQELLAGLLKSFPHALLNKAGGISGLFFQLYLVVWILWTAFFALRGEAFIPELTSFQKPGYSGLASMLAPFLLYILVPYLPVYLHWIYYRTAGTKKRRQQELQAYGLVRADPILPSKIEVGINSSLYFQVSNPTGSKLENVWIRVVFPECIRCTSPQAFLGALMPGASRSVSIDFVPTCAGKVDLGVVDLYFEMKGKEFRKNPLTLGACEIACSCLDISAEVPPLDFGHKASLKIVLRNNSSVSLNGISVRCSFSRGIEPDIPYSEIDGITPGSCSSLSFGIIPRTYPEASLGHFSIRFNINGNECYVGPVDFGKHRIAIPEIDVRMNMPTAFYRDVPVSVGIIVDNLSDEPLSNICFTSCFSSQIECESPVVCIPAIDPGSSRYASLSMKPVTGGTIDLGNLNISFEVKGNLCYREPIALGTYRVA